MPRGRTRATCSGRDRGPPSSDGAAPRACGRRPARAAPAAARAHAPHAAGGAPTPTTRRCVDAWDFVGRLDLPDRQLVLAQTADEIGYTPDRWAGAVRHVGPGERDWRRLPSARARAGVWGPGPDVALNLAPPSDLGAALLVGASPAALRVGVHDPDRESFYDLMIRQPPGDPVASVERLLRRLDPPIVPFA